MTEKKSSARKKTSLQDGRAPAQPRTSRGVPEKEGTGQSRSRARGKKILAVGKRMFPFGSTGWGWDPILCLESIRLTMNTLYGELFKKSESFFEEIPWEPPADIYLDRGRIYIDIELPGVKKEQISIHATTTLLIVDGRKISESDPGEMKYDRMERKFGRFYRSIPLPFSAVPEELGAELRDGLLRISLPIKDMNE
jgi:HSP20 family protein